MKTLYPHDIGQSNIGATVVTIGNFDGVHRGHQQIFALVQDCARQNEATSLVVTFEPHPLTVIAPASAPTRITSLPEKERLIAASGIDCLLVIPFTREFSATPAREFVTGTLLNGLHMTHLFIGYDYAFGRNREGDVTLLQQLAQEHDFKIHVVDPIGNDDTIFSSSAVRRQVLCGEVADVADLLGRPYALTGTVIHGREIGRGIGFPTANIATDAELVPADGVYAVTVEMDGIHHDAACSISNNPTFGGVHRSIEVFLLDFQGDLYGKKLCVSFMERVRGIISFPDAASLVRQITEDIKSCREILSKTRKTA